MGIRSQVVSIKQHFIDNWVASPVHYSNTEYVATTSGWIFLDVIPISNRGRGYDSACGNTFTLINVVAFGRDEIESGALADDVIAFLENANIDGLQVGPWQLIAAVPNGNTNFSHSLSFDVRN